MKSSLLCATFVASFVAVFAALNLQAQQSGPAPARGPAPNVAVVDVGFIFKNHIHFKQQMDAMGKDVEADEKAFKREQDDMARDVDKLKNGGLRPESPDFKRQEEAIAKRESDLNLKVQIRKRNYMEQEAKIYYDTYREISDEIKRYADRNGIALVVRYNGHEPIQSTSRDAVLKEVNKNVVYNQRGIDITDDIKQVCNARAIPNGTANPKAAGVRPNQTGPK